MDVEIRNLQPAPIDEELLAAAARLACEAAGKPIDVVGIAIVDDGRIRTVNRRFRNTDAATDVIAFDAEEEAGRRTGEVIVSAETAARQADQAGHSLHAELCLLVAHGVLHALGYEDDDEDSRARMERLQERVLGELKGVLGQHDR